MALADDLPVAESIGVFVGIAGIEWLAYGYAEPLKALLAGIAAGAVIMAIRVWRRKRQKP
ncbi:MAG: hypothetical protein FWF20_03415 [Betaproteobacteria bacterium]|nr:hypothetical protein [Betaproteobacteria bacterium]MCL2885831.1 hypothetical protein [Betaproteobacteria bacterium]